MLFVSDVEYNVSPIYRAIEKLSDPHLFFSFFVNVENGFTYANELLIKVVSLDHVLGSNLFN